MDMDMEMDIDMGMTEELIIPDIDILAEPKVSALQETPVALDIPNDTTEENAREVTPQKVHLRGLDNLTTKDILAFASEHYDLHRPVRVEWIDDTSANLIYDTPEIAQAALVAFAAVEAPDVSQLPTLQAIPAKAFPLHPDTKLVVRLAVVGDRKQAGARERSRFYLFNPEHDPAERRKQSNRGPRNYRDREDGGYRSQRYDDNEQERRERESNFDASLYDDDAAAIAQRADRSTRRGPPSSSENRGREDRGGRYPKAAGRELFPSRDDRGSGRLRNRSASPTRDRAGAQDIVEARIAERRRINNEVASANRVKAQAIKAQLREASATKELFPQKVSPKHRRSAAFNAADEAADLFASRMPVPFMDGSSDSRARGGSLASRITIRGSALSPSSQGFNIKGASRVKELFPATLGDNSGKELFSEKLEGRGRRRQKAEDLFY
ncbi:uncharacterized protein L3040_004152 [Drepanopeziza brunnea f. sp. 'multigermtubi']|uniref:Conserved fungal protein n=1 Tax=Marssonina brunnea f. sp. multigermtubi (strain MB_m1) TaxID=1072389 RepID=K1X5Y8_MARBU|nr:uncharacterized protein MBM_01239 [Drepanopeziza brunnea f. sp. 'multigermtubi' MB_m1]EKD20557.1 conserved fungal protein [Drepanopeziza brunnea f. sp. 'multigermtubi' MB_m1]KAJ5042756.1 hypothetical protein L3040_004152 [Drepanopeziza brunnea f. sp. 'multigermtubi']